MSSFVFNKIEQQLFLVQSCPCMITLKKYINRLCVEMAITWISYVCVCVSQPLIYQRVIQTFQLYNISIDVYCIDLTGKIFLLNRKHLVISSMYVGGRYDTVCGKQVMVFPRIFYMYRQVYRFNTYLLRNTMITRLNKQAFQLNCTYWYYLCMNPINLMKLNQLIYIL